MDYKIGDYVYIKSYIDAVKLEVGGFDSYTYHKNYKNIKIPELYDFFKCNSKEVIRVKDAFNYQIKEFGKILLIKENFPSLRGSISNNDLLVETVIGRHIIISSLNVVDVSLSVSFDEKDLFLMKFHTSEAFFNKFMREYKLKRLLKI